MGPRLLFSAKAWSHARQPACLPACLRAGAATRTQAKRSEAGPLRVVRYRPGGSRLTIARVGDFLKGRWKVCFEPRAQFGDGVKTIAAEPVGLARLLAHSAYASCGTSRNDLLMDVLFAPNWRIDGRLAFVASFVGSVRALFGRPDSTGASVRPPSAAAALPAPFTGASIDSEGGSFVNPDHDGQSYGQSFGADQVFGPYDNNNLIGFSLGGTSPGPDNWSLVFGAPNDGVLEPGTYTDTVRYTGSQ